MFPPLEAIHSDSLATIPTASYQKNQFNSHLLDQNHPHTNINTNLTKKKSPFVITSDGRNIKANQSNLVSNQIKERTENNR